MTVNLNFKSALFLLLSVIILTFSCKDENLNIQDFKDSLDALEGTTISSINEQITSINKSISDLKEANEALEAYIKALEATATDLQKQIDDANTGVSNLRTELLAINNTLEKLKKADEALDKKITDLQAYVDTQLTAMTNWANATFATLEQYSAVQTEISAITSLIDKTKDDIAKEYATAIETAISNSETGMKAWVNALLAQGYYTISDIDGKVSALEALISDGDTNLQNQINEQKAALQQAKADLTNEYKQYINQAIASGGIIDQAIASQVKKAQDALQAQIDVINERLDSLEDRLGKLEEDFVNRIQSLKYIPEYSDGKVMVSDICKMNITLDFLVTPASQAETIKNAWELNPNVISAYFRNTKSPATRAINSSIPLEIVSINVVETGVLNINITEKEGDSIDNDKWYQDFEGIIYVRVSDGNTDIASDFVCIETYYDDLSNTSSLNMLESNDLSPRSGEEYQSANCYVVSEAGVYKFKAYKGCSQELAGALTVNPHPMGVIGKVEVLWESFGMATKPQNGELIQHVAFYEESIYFRTPEDYSEGNAVIAAKDVKDNILWTWHIWLTDKPSEQEYYNNAGTMMDRNLGAISATPGDVGALGLLYQWGRKDPFLGASGIKSQYSSSSSLSPSTDWEQTYSNSKTGQIQYAIMHPTTFITSNDYNDDWYYTGSKETDTNRWNDVDGEKTVYDPCPYGWRVPDSSVWSQALGESNISISYDSENLGINCHGLFGEDSVIWYPLAGFRNNAGLSSVGQSGYVMSSSVHLNSSNIYWPSCMYLLTSSIHSISSCMSYNGHSIRCQKDI